MNTENGFTAFLNSALSFLSRLLLTDLVGQCGDDDPQVGQGAVDGRHLFEALTLRLTLQHSLTASQVYQAQSGYVHKNKQKTSTLNQIHMSAMYTVKSDYKDNTYHICRNCISCNCAKSHRNINVESIDPIFFHCSQN